MTTFTILSGDDARAAESLAREATSPAQLEALRAHGASTLFCEQPGRPLPYVVRLDAPCLAGQFVDEDEFYRHPPRDLVAVSRWGGVSVRSGGEELEAPELAAIEPATVGAFSTGPILLLRWVGDAPSSADELQGLLDATDDAYAAWWQDWDARGRPF